MKWNRAYQARQLLARNTEVRQFRLLTLLLLVTAVAASISAWRVHREIESTTEKIELVRLLGRQLNVRDDTQFALVYENSIWEGERKCKVFLPKGSSYRFHVSLEGKWRQPPPQGMKDAAFVSLTPGEHTIRHYLHTQKSGITKIYVYVDDELIYEEVHEVGWLKYNYAFTERMDVQRISIQQPTDSPLEIWRGVGSSLLRQACWTVYAV